MKDNEYDIIVVGGGHAGVEASHAGAKMGLKTLLITHLIDNIALASCNPAIGGLGKGHLVKEIDSLGGLMGLITDISGLQYRILNSSKGPAVRGTRAQIDMDIYKRVARDILLSTKNLNILQLEVTKILANNHEAIGVQTNIKKDFFAKKIIITSGTFLKGLVHIGEYKSQNGRANEISSNALSDSLKSLGIPLDRLKTGTCPRILGASIDQNILEKHYGDCKNNFSAPYFSLYLSELLNNENFRNSEALKNKSYETQNIKFDLLQNRIINNTFVPKELPCFVVYTNENTHKIIRDNFYRAPLFTGQIQGVGPRYCPSIEDKVDRFSDKSRHQLFLEPQTISQGEYYINGLSTSLPFEVQEEIIKSISGIENCTITRYGYAIEYDYSQPTNLTHTLESKIVKNLYLAGQINGTTGYEEAAAQGIFAGINAALEILQKEKFILKRNEGYIGVMIDDLVTKGTNEPYRVFTSRAEYRLLLREDNACFRLLKYAKKFNLLDKEILQSLEKDQADINNNLDFLNTSFYPNKENLQILEDIEEDKVNNKCNMSLIIGRDSMNVEKLRKFQSRFKDLSARALLQLQIHSKYHSYIKKQQDQINKIDSTLKIKIPENINFSSMSGLSLEVVEKLEKFKPKTLFEASLISGVTPASLEVLELNIVMFCRAKQN